MSAGGNDSRTHEVERLANRQIAACCDASATRGETMFSGGRLLRRSGFLALPILVMSTAAWAGTVELATPAQTPAQEAKQAPKKSGNPVTDSWITMKIHSQFIPEDSLEGSDIDVDTNAGV